MEVNLTCRCDRIYFLNIHQRFLFIFTQNLITNCCLCQMKEVSCLPDDKIIFEISTISKLHNFEMPTCYKLDMSQRLSKKWKRSLP